MKTASLWLMVVVGITALSGTLCAVPPMINYQGKLMQSNGTPVPDGEYRMAFAIYGQPTGGTALWSEVNEHVQIRGGLYSVLLGSVINLPANIFDAPDRFFGVKVGEDPEMMPRQKMQSVPFAQRAGNGVPAGTVLTYAGNVVPDGWIPCDGREINRVDYPALFAAIGVSWGSGDDTTTFNIPDLRGMFLRGVNGGTGRDPDSAARAASHPGGNIGDAVGSVQTDAFQGHWHDYLFHQYPAAWSGQHGLVDISTPAQSSVPYPDNSEKWPIRGARTDGLHGMPRLANETRPMNAYVGFIINTGQ